jgi:hypothetical protein
MADTTPLPAELWAQAFQTWIDGWRALAVPSAAADPFQLWRRSYDQWLAAWSVVLEGMLQTPEAAAASGRMLDAILNIEKPVRERTASTMQYWLDFFNLPSNNGLQRLAVQVNDANARLDDLQEQLEDLADQVAKRGLRTED